MYKRDGEIYKEGVFYLLINFCQEKAISQSGLGSSVPDALVDVLHTVSGSQRYQTQDDEDDVKRFLV